MLTPEYLEGLRVAFSRLSEPLEEYLIKDIARRVSEAGQLTSTAAYQIWRLQNMGKVQEDVLSEVARLLGKEVDEAAELFEQAAEVGYRFDLSNLPTSDAVPFSENFTAQQITSTAIKSAGEQLKNLTQTIGFVGADGIDRTLTDAYINAADYAFNLISSGSADRGTAIRRACKNLTSKGIRTVDYASGVHTSLEAAVRRDMTGGLGLMVEQISQNNHDELGADGWEITAHANSAPDHEPIQGKQYTDDEFQRLNNSLRRRIGTLNCGHNAFPIVIGVSSAQYTKRELDTFRHENAKGVSYEGRKFETVYEASQYQRQIERAIRTQKRRVWQSQGMGDKEYIKQTQTRLQTLGAEYKRFSRSVGLRTEDERLYVAKIKS